MTCLMRLDDYGRYRRLVKICGPWRWSCAANADFGPEATLQHRHSQENMTRRTQQRKQTNNDRCSVVQVKNDSRVTGGKVDLCVCVVSWSWNSRCIQRASLHVSHYPWWTGVTLYNIDMNSLVTCGTILVKSLRDSSHHFLGCNCLWKFLQWRSSLLNPSWVSWVSWAMDMDGPLGCKQVAELWSFGHFGQQEEPCHLATRN